VYVGLASASGTFTQKHLWGSDGGAFQGNRTRESIRHHSALSALNWLRLQLLTVDQ
jgi:hypothetical protein